MTQIKSKIEEDFALANGIGRFSVVVADSSVNVKWYKDGKEIPKNISILKIEQISVETQRTLIVKNCVDADFCRYTVKTDDDNEEHSCYLTKALTKDEYFDKVNKKVFVSGPVDQKTQPGGSCRFSAIVTDNFAEVQWLKDGKSVNGKQTKKGQERTFELSNCSADAEISIVCNKEKRSAKLKVSTVVEKQIRSKIEEDFALVNGIGRFSAVVADSTVNVKWFKDGKQIPKDVSILKIEQIAFKTQRTLIVKNCVDADFCRYTIKTQDGKEEHSCNLSKARSRDEYFDKMNKKIFVSGPVDQETQSGGSCRFSTIVTNSFAKVQWLKDGKGVDGKQENKGQERTIELSNCSADAEISVVCNNEKRSAKLKVSGGDQKPKSEPKAEPKVEQKSEQKSEQKPVQTKTSTSKVSESESEPEERMTIRDIIDGGPWKKNDDGHWKSTTIIKRIVFKPLPDPLIRAETLSTKWAFDGARWAPIPV